MGKNIASKGRQRRCDAGGGEGREVNKQDGDIWEKGKNLTKSNREGGRGEKHGRDQADEQGAGLEGEGQGKGQKDEGQNEGQKVEERDGDEESEGQGKGQEDERHCEGQEGNKGQGVVAGDEEQGGNDSKQQNQDNSVIVSDMKEEV